MWIVCTPYPVQDETRHSAAVLHDTPGSVNCCDFDAALWGNSAPCWMNAEDAVWIVYFPLVESLNRGGVYHLQSLSCTLLFFNTPKVQQRGGQGHFRTWMRGSVQNTRSSKIILIKVVPTCAPPGEFDVSFAERSSVGQRQILHRDGVHLCWRICDWRSQGSSGHQHPRSDITAELWPEHGLHAGQPRQRKGHLYLRGEGHPVMWTVPCAGMSVCVHALTRDGLKISKCLHELWPTATDPNCRTGSLCSFSPELVKPLNWRWGYLAGKTESETDWIYFISLHILILYNLFWMKNTQKKTILQINWLFITFEFPADYSLFLRRQKDSKKTF